MTFHVAKILCALGTISLSRLLTSGGAEVRASFLQDTKAISQTIEFLINCGCTRQGTTAVAVSRDVGA